MAAKIEVHVDENGTATLLLNRPEVHNAFDPEMVDQLATALGKMRARSDVRAVVLMGAGASFCAGADIAYMKPTCGWRRGRGARPPSCWPSRPT